ncbi:MAG: hypothetical protein ABIN83_05735 [Sphingomicrobium sp.]
MRIVSAMMSALVAATAFLSVPIAAQKAAPPKKVSLVEALPGVRSELDVDSQGRLSGPGATLLKEAISAARFIAVGEDHFTHEIPLFVSALCDLTAPDLAALALEVGPRSLKLLEPGLAAPDREQRMKRVFANHPNAVAFLDSRDDNAMAAHCQKTSRNRAFRLIGADQEFVNAPSFLLDRILVTRLSPVARRAMIELKKRNHEAEARTRATGDPSQLFLFSADDKAWADAEKALVQGGNPEARGILADLRESHSIYALNSSPTPAMSNERRARLLKRNLVAGLPERGKVILKFGDWHLYKGFNPLKQRDLGNFVAEYADMRGERSLHILVLGAKGTHAAFAGFAKPPVHAPFVMSDDKDYHWFKAAVGAQLSSGWTLYDLRALRFRSLDMDADWTRTVYGYDLMIVIPELTPSEAF